MEEVRSLIRDFHSGNVDQRKCRRTKGADCAQIKPDASVKYNGKCGVGSDMNSKCCCFCYFRCCFYILGFTYSSIFMHFFNACLFFLRRADTYHIHILKYASEWQNTWRSLTQKMNCKKTEWCIKPENCKVWIKIQEVFIELSQQISLNTLIHLL